MPPKTKQTPTAAPEAPKRPWWEIIALDHSKSDREAGRPLKRCPCMGCERARREGFRFDQLGNRVS